MQIPIDFIDGNLSVNHYTTRYGHTITRVDTGEHVAEFEYADETGDEVFVDGQLFSSLRDALRTLDR